MLKDKDLEFANSIRYFDTLVTPAASRAWVSNNSFEKSLFTSILSRTFFDIAPSAGFSMQTCPLNNSSLARN